MTETRLIVDRRRGYKIGGRTMRDEERCDREKGHFDTASCVGGMCLVILLMTPGIFLASYFTTRDVQKENAEMRIRLDEYRRGTRIHVGESAP